MPTKRELRLYGDLIKHYRPSFKSMIINSLVSYFTRKNMHKASPNKDGISIAKEKAPDGPLNPEMYSNFALVNNGIVEQVIIVNSEIANLLKSKKTQIVHFEKTDKVFRGTQYINGKFTNEEIKSEED